MAETNEVGAIWIREDKNGNKYLAIGLGGEDCVGYPAKEKKTETSPDYNIVKYNEKDESELVGAAWKGTTKKDRQKLTIKMNDGRYFTAVMRDGVDEQPEGSKRAHMTVFGGEEK